MIRLLAGILALLLVACDYVETTREVGHKGKARVNPYLAAERMLEELGYENLDKPGWPDLEDAELGLVVVPASVLSAEGYVRALEEWVEWGGHAVILLEHGEAYLNDWGDVSWRDLWVEAEQSEALDDWR